MAPCGQNQDHQEERSKTMDTQERLERALDERVVEPSVVDELVAACEQALEFFESSNAGQCEDAKQLRAALKRAKGERG
jgi:hypothetical protein